MTRATDHEPPVAPRLMTHLVAFYPDRDASLAIGKALAGAGASYLELQFPFSDPSADGPVIQEACRQALDPDRPPPFTTAGGFELAGELVKATETPLFIMSYASLAYAPGIERFLDRAAKAGATGVIVPDLPPGCDEGLYRAARRLGLEAVPVVSPGITRERLELVAAQGSSYLYATLRAGVTGKRTSIGRENVEFLERLAATGKRILAGFGISEAVQVRMLTGHVHACVVGSAIVRAVAECRAAAPADAAAATVRRLLAGAKEAVAPATRNPGHRRMVHGDSR